MSKNFYYNNDVCVVGIGCVLPDANNPQEFWGNLSVGRCSIRKMPEERFKSRLYLSDDKNAEDKAYSNYAAFVENPLLFKQYKGKNRLQAMALEATRQSLEHLSPDTLKRAKKNTAVFLGCMDVDEAFAVQRFYRHNSESLKKYVEEKNLRNGREILTNIKKHFSEEDPPEEEIVSSMLTSSVVGLIKKNFGFRGEGALVDAACASSIAAMDVSVNALRDHKVDMVITGGIEGNLGPDTFVLFSKVGALSKGRCAPFDQSADGLSQGEGAVIFALQRVEDALKDGNTIYGVIRSIGGSSDGKSSSLFSPSSGGQILALRRAYEGFDKMAVDYIECHGTGTKIGDKTELRSLNEFFKGARIPIGSVKSLIGHTKGAAGGAGLLKCLLSMKNKTIPPSKYVKNSAAPLHGAVRVNKKTVAVKKKNSQMRFGISSFGFGNINYHAVVDEFKNDFMVLKKENMSPDDNEIVIIGKGVSSSKIDPKSIKEKFNIPPRSVPQADKVHFQALLSVADAFERSNIKIDSLDKENVFVISATTLGLGAAFDLADRVRHFEFKGALSFLDSKSIDLMIGHKNKFPKVTEDTGPGILNNVISGRICNAFDFKGKNFNIDADLNSFPAALNIAVRELRSKGGVAVLVFCEEELDKKKMRVQRKKVSCLLLSTLGLAKKENYPIRELIKRIGYHD
ncbi:MAG: hypothetical protein NUV49_01680 [Patescibacteria group bacterium]|nr:hypothetical protein [Patescibacteria group bacterium]